MKQQCDWMWWGPLTNQKPPRAIDQSQLLHAPLGRGGAWKGHEGARRGTEGHGGGTEGCRGAQRGHKGAQIGCRGAHRGCGGGCLSMVTIGQP